MVEKRMKYFPTDSEARNFQQGLLNNQIHAELGEYNRLSYVEWEEPTAPTGEPETPGRTIPQRPEPEEPHLQPDWERFYLYRVELYLVHKYAPELVDEMKVTFASARLRRESYIKKDEGIFASKEKLLDQIIRDLDCAPLKRKREVHRSKFERPGIGVDYQRDFNNL